MAILNYTTKVPASKTVSQICATLAKAIISGVVCHGVIDGNTITLHDHQAGVAWEKEP